MKDVGREKGYIHVTKGGAESEKGMERYVRGTGNFLNAVFILMDVNGKMIALCTPSLCFVHTICREGKQERGWDSCLYSQTLNDM